MKDLNKYIKGNLNESELESFTQRLLEEKFGKEDKQKWASMLEEQYGIKQPSKSKQKNSATIKRLWLRVGAVAATILLLVAVITILNRPTSSIVDIYLAEQKYEYGVDRKNIDLADLRSQAGDAYKVDNYKRAINLWEQIVQQETASTQDYLYLGLSYLYDEQAGAALVYLLEARQRSIEEDDSFTEDINWLLPLAYVKNGEAEKALVELRKIKETEWNYMLAQQLIKQLQE